MCIKKKFFTIAIIIFISNFIHAAGSNDEEYLKQLARLEIDPEENAEDKADKIFKMSLLLDSFAIKDLYFKGFIEEAEDLLYMISIGYKMVLGYYPNHPLAQLFFDAHNHPNDSGLSVEGDPTSMVAISGLYTDGIEDDVPDDFSMQAFWFARSAKKSELAKDGQKLLEDRQKGAWVTFSAKELASLLAFEGTGIASGFAAGQVLQNTLNEAYWIYIGLGVGAAGGALAWFAGSQCYNMCQQCKQRYQNKKNLKKLAIASEEDDRETADIIAMEEGRKTTSKNKHSDDNTIPNIDITENSSLEKLSKYDSLSYKEKKKLKDKYLIHLYGTSDDDRRFVALYRDITKHERITTKNTELHKRSPRSITTHEEGTLKRWSNALLHRLSSFNPWRRNPTPIEEKHKDRHLDDDSLDAKLHTQSLPNTSKHDNEDLVEVDEQPTPMDDYQINNDDDNIQKAEKIFRIVLNLDNFSIKRLHFKGHIKEAEKLMYMIAVGYKIVVGYNPDHPYAQLFFDAHDHPDEDGLMIPGDQTAQKAISALFSDDIDDEVPDDLEVEAYWIGRSLIEPGQSIKPVSAQEKHKTSSLISFTAKEFGALCAAEAGGIVAGYGVGQVLSEALGAYYWNYIGLGIGGAGGFLVWLGGLKIPEIYHWCSTKLQHKDDLQELDNITDDDQTDAVAEEKVVGQEIQQLDVQSTTTDKVNEFEIDVTNLDDIHKAQSDVIPESFSQKMNEDEDRIINPSPSSKKPVFLGSTRKQSYLNSYTPKTSNQQPVQPPKLVSRKEEDGLHEKFIKHLAHFGADDPFVRRYLDLTKFKRVEATQEVKAKHHAANQNVRQNFSRGKSDKHSKIKRHIHFPKSINHSHLHSDEELEDEDDLRLKRSKKVKKESHGKSNPYGSSSSHYQAQNQQYDDIDDIYDPYDDIYYNPNKSTSVQFDEDE